MNIHTVKDYTIDSGTISLEKITNSIRCQKCNHTLAVKGRGSWLFKYPVACDFTSFSATSRCPKCKTFNSFDVTREAGKIAV